jgi:hypothetical protein
MMSKPGSATPSSGTVAATSGICGPFTSARIAAESSRLSRRCALSAEKIADLKDFHDAGWLGRYMGLDPTDAPLLLRDVGSEDIYALTLDRK